MKTGLHPFILSALLVPLITAATSRPANAQGTNPTKQDGTTTFHIKSGVEDFCLTALGSNGVTFTRMEKDDPKQLWICEKLGNDYALIRSESTGLYLTDQLVRLKKDTSYSII